MNNYRTNMKVPPNSNSVNEIDSFDDEPYYNEGPTVHMPAGNALVEEYTPPTEDADFSEYLWMENEEEFDKEVMQRLEEEELMEQCMMQHMLEVDRPSNLQNANSNLIENDLGKSEYSEMAKSSTLNPYAAEFVPGWRCPSTESKAA